jgi:phosphomannomutase/phosphoglucomutase
MNTLDGIRVEFEDGWFLARPSNTQPVLVLRFEFLTEEALKRVQTEIEGIVNKLL